MCERCSRAVTSRWLVGRIDSRNLQNVIGVSGGIVARETRVSAQRHADTRASRQHPQVVAIEGSSRPPVRSSGPPAKSVPAKVALEPRRFRAAAASACSDSRSAASAASAPGDISGWQASTMSAWMLGMSNSSATTWATSFSCGSSLSVMCSERRRVSVPLPALAGCGVVNDVGWPGIQSSRHAGCPLAASVP